MRYIVWGSELSPFTLKLNRLLRQARLPYRSLPAEGGWLENWRYALKRYALLAGVQKLTWPRITTEDELPLVPFLYGEDGSSFYDTSAIATWLDQQHGTQFVPDDPQTSFLVRLLDEYADEFGLYMVHHNRWTVSAQDNDAGPRLALETRKAIPFSGLYGKWFSRRQVRRLPYLFSVAPADATWPNLAKKRQPPSVAGFPATHAFLETSFSQLLAALENILNHQPYLFGTAFTLADASLAGQLGMNLTDPSAARWIEQMAPATYAWTIRLNGNTTLPTSGTAAIDDRVRPLITEVIRCFIPYMQQNAAAHASLKDQRRNERAFNQHRALYDGEIDGQAYRHVAKSFQAKVWRDLCEAWQELAGPTTLNALGLNDSQFGSAAR